MQLSLYESHFFSGPDTYSSMQRYGNRSLNAVTLDGQSVEIDCGGFFSSTVRVKFWLGIFD